jgi:uncharacterized protein YbjT (DUF2867 family)
MKILLTGATGYIAKRLLPVLLEGGHEVVCCVRDKQRFNSEKYHSEKISIIEVNFLERDSLNEIPEDIDIAYYLIHSMSTTKGDFEEMEKISALNFKERIEKTQTRQVIYLSGIVNEEALSKHLHSRKTVEETLFSTNYSLTSLRAGIIVGSGSASFEIIRDLVEKLPVMVAPKWLDTTTQPIAIRNVIQYLSGVLLRKETYNQSFDIGGPDVITYKQMLLGFAKVRGLQRYIYTVPVMTPKLSSYWLYFITSTSFPLAANLVDSMKIKVICQKNNLAELLGIKLLTYEQAIELAFDKIEQNQVLSSWKDALGSKLLDIGISELIEVPEHGCFKDKKSIAVNYPDKTLQKIWSIGGENGWYYGNWLWNIRGFLDKMAGGVGRRRGRRSPTELTAGDSLDFWRVILADKTRKRLLLYAEMKLPGEAWLEFSIDNRNILHQNATFRPKGVWGRLYWFTLLPFHAFIFIGMIRRIAS